MREENCNPPTDTDWKDVSIVEIMLGAEMGIPGAEAELQRIEKQIDTVSAKALTVEWIED